MSGGKRSERRTTEKSRLGTRGRRLIAENGGRGPWIALSVAILSLLLFTAASCGKQSASQTPASSTKPPPGMSESDVSTFAGENSSQGENPSTGATGTNSADSSTSSATPSVAKTVTVSGLEFTVLTAKRETNNNLVAASGTREVNGDFLEVELSIKNVGNSLISLSRFSFRLWNPSIIASSYDDYYGNVTTYGGYVSTNIISAALLDYASLKEVSYTLKSGEEIGDVFLFFDLNPLSVSRNQGFTKEGANLIIYDTETGDKAEINLAGYPD